MWDDIYAHSMVKCPDCGYENTTDSHYCVDCGHRLDSKDDNKERNISESAAVTETKSKPVDIRETPGIAQVNTERTITARVKEGTSHTVHHFNIDNIAYIEITDVELTTLALALIFGVSLSMFTILLTQTSFLAALIIAGIIAIAISALIAELDSVSLGTLTQKHKLKGSQVTRMEEEFLGRSRQTISVEGSEKSPYNIFTYRYHFVPDNIVSIQHERGRSYNVPLILAGLGTLSLFLFTSYTDSFFTGFTIMSIFLIAAYYAEPFEKLDKILIDLQNDEDIEFRMPADHVEEFIEDFRYRQDTKSDPAKLKFRAKENPEAVDIAEIAGYLESNDTESQLHALEALAWISNNRPAAVRSLIDNVKPYLTHDRKSARRHAVAILTGIAQEYPEDVAQTTQDLVDRIIEEEPMSSTRELAAIALASISEIYPQLVGDALATFLHPEPPFDYGDTSLYKDPDDFYQEHAMLVLAHLSDFHPEELLNYVDEFTTFLEKDELRIRNAAAHALANIAKVEPESVCPAVPQLIALLDDDNETILLGTGQPPLEAAWPKPCSNAALALGHVSDTCLEDTAEAVEGLLQLLDHADSTVRKNASIALGEIEEQDAIPKLKEGLRTETDEQVSTVMQTAIENIERT